MSLQVENLCWGHPVPGGGRRELFRNFAFSSGNGEFTVVIGSNGSGKSTFLNLLAGTLRSDSGSIRLDDQPLQQLPDHRRARRIGRVMQNPLEGTCPGLTIAENLRLAEGLLCGSARHRRVRPPQRTANAKRTQRSLGRP